MILVRNELYEVLPSKKATHPCKCGYYGDPKRECRRSPREVQKYRERVSGPLPDRIDIHVEVPAVAYAELSAKDLGESSASIRERISQVRKIQHRRLSGKPQLSCHARMTSRLIKIYCQLDDGGLEMLKMAMTELHFRARAYDRILKVAGTITDLNNSDKINVDHIGEAIQYRTLDRNL